MKKYAGIFAVSAIAILALALLSREVISQAQAQDAASENTQFSQLMDRLDKIESQLEEILENQQQTFAELKRGRYFTKRS